MAKKPQEDDEVFVGPQGLPPPRAPAVVSCLEFTIWSWFYRCLLRGKLLARINHSGDSVTGWGCVGRRGKSRSLLIG